MDPYSDPVLDHNGKVMFRCEACGTPICRGDILDFGVRLPEVGESAGEYLDAQLIDAFRHERCVAAARAS
ncbi:MAG: hypothetical protein ACREH4_16785 [Vitreimonas sp.]